MTYTVKNVKTFIGNEGHGFNASLYEGTKRVALVIDDAWGGCYQYQFIDKEAEQRFGKFIKEDLPPKREIVRSRNYGDYIGMVDIGMGTMEKGEDGYDYFVLPYTDDSYIGMLVDEYLSRRELRKKTKKQILYYDKDDNNIYQLPASRTPSEKNIELLKKAKWWKPDNIVINELSEDEAIKIWMQAA